MRVCLCFGLFLQRLEVDLPGDFAFDTGGKPVGFLAPPARDEFELFDAKWFGLGIAFHALWVAVLVVPNGICGPSLGEEEEVSLDARVRVEDAIGQAD